MSKLTKALTAAAGNAGAEFTQFLTASSSRKNLVITPETRIFGLDESTDALTELDISGGPDTALAAAFAPEGDVLFTVELVSGVSGTCYLKAYEWSGTGLGALITQATIIGSTNTNLFSQIAVAPAHTRAGAAGINQIAVYTSGAWSVYICAFDGSTLTYQTGWTNYDATTQRNMSFDFAGNRIVQAQFRNGYGVKSRNITSGGTLSNTSTYESTASQHAVFNGNSDHILVAMYQGDKIFPITTTSPSYTSSNATVGVCCNSDNLAAWSWGVGFVTGSGGFSAFATFPNIPGNTELYISNSNLYDNNIRYIFAAGYRNSQRLYKVDTNAQTVTDLGVPFTGSYDPNVGSFSR